MAEEVLSKADLQYIHDVKISHDLRFIHVRYIFVGLVNFIFANILFVALWHLGHNRFLYWQIALIVTVFSAFFSYFTQHFFTFKSDIFSLRTILRFVSIQLLWLPIGVLLVPTFADILQTSIIIVQIIFTFMVVIVNWKILSPLLGKVPK
jgi:hypothetical protein